MVDGTRQVIKWLQIVLINQIKTSGCFDYGEFEKSGYLETLYLLPFEGPAPEKTVESYEFGGCLHFIGLEKQRNQKEEVDDP